MQNHLFRNALAVIGGLMICSSAAIAAVAVPDDLKQGEANLQQGNYDAAFKLLQPLADKGNRAAQTHLGAMYEAGQGVQPDPIKALEYYKKAAHAASGPRLSVRLKGEAQINRPEEAAKTFQELADKGDAFAQNELGFLYLHGDGVKRDVSHALSLFKLSAAQNNPEGLCNLGFMYQHGAGVTQDYPTAMKYYLQAANKGNAIAQNNLGFLYTRGLGVEPDQTKAMEWFKQAAAGGDIDAVSNMGWLYQSGTGVPKDLPKAVQLFAKAAAYGLPAARYNLGYMYQTGKGVPQDYVKASHLYTVASMEGAPTAQSDLGFMYETGEGVPKSYDQALKYYKGKANARVNFDMQMDSMETVSP